MEILSDWESLDFEKIIALYDSVGWSRYTKDPKSLRTAFENSTLVLIAVDGDEVVGASRSLSDNVSIHFLQDILVLPTFQSKGLGRKLLVEVLERFRDVRTHVLLTDDGKKQHAFYNSIGFRNVKLLKEVPLNAFVKMNGVELK